MIFWEPGRVRCSKRADVMNIIGVSEKLNSSWRHHYFWSWWHWVSVICSHGRIEGKVQCYAWDTLHMFFTSFLYHMQWKVRILLPHVLIKHIILRIGIWLVTWSFGVYQENKRGTFDISMMRLNRPFCDMRTGSIMIILLNFLHCLYLAM